MHAACFLVEFRASSPENGHMQYELPVSMHASCVKRSNVILKICPFSGHEALRTTRKHVACTNGVSCAASPARPPGASPGASSPVAASATTSTGARYTASEESRGDILYVFEDRLTVDELLSHPSR
jgi:hypothetical protein